MKGFEERLSAPPTGVEFAASRTSTERCAELLEDGYSDQARAVLAGAIEWHAPHVLAAPNRRRAQGRARLEREQST